MMQLLQVEGEGAPHLGVVDFIEEHFTGATRPRGRPTRRTGASASTSRGGSTASTARGSTTSSCSRTGASSSRTRCATTPITSSASTSAHGLLIEWQKTGFRSMEHDPRTTGFTNAGRVVGSPLGPDAEALFVGGRIARGQGTLYPWFEVARLSSDTVLVSATTSRSCA